MTSTATLFEYVAYPYEVAGRDSFSEGRLHLTEETLDRLDTLNETKRFLRHRPAHPPDPAHVCLVKAGGIILRHTSIISSVS